MEALVSAPKLDLRTRAIFRAAPSAMGPLQKNCPIRETADPQNYYNRFRRSRIRFWLQTGAGEDKSVSSFAPIMELGGSQFKQLL